MGLHRRPRPGVGAGFIDDGGHQLPLRFRVGEAVLRPGIGNGLAVGLGIRHFRQERRQMVVRNQFVLRAVAHQDLRTDLALFSRGHAVQRAVETHHAQHIGVAGPGQFQNGAAAEAIADGGDLPVAGRMRLQRSRFSLT